MAGTDEDGFITLPPGIFDVSTLPSAPQAERPSPARDDIVFVQSVPGAQPPPPPPAPAAPVAPPAPAASAPQAPSVSWALVLPEGGEAVVGEAVVVGRNPARPDAWPGSALLALQDSTHSVSKTHAVFQVDESGLWVHDLDSTNGVWVVNGTDVTEVSPGRRVRVPETASVELGDYVLTVRTRVG